MGDATVVPAEGNEWPAAKFCSQCSRTLPRSAFNKRARAVDGLQIWCRDCEHAYAKTRRELKHEDELERGRKWRADNPERARAATRRQYKANTGRRRESSQQWRERNPDKVREGFRAWRAANLEQAKARERRYRQEHPEVPRAQVRRRRARILGNGAVERFTDAEIVERDGWTCGLCQLPVDPALRWPDPGSLVIDHIIPLALGGTHTRANVQVAHHLCNARKGARLGETA